MEKTKSFTLIASLGLSFFVLFARRPGFAEKLPSQPMEKCFSDHHKHHKEKNQAKLHLKKKRMLVPLFKLFGVRVIKRKFGHLHLLLSFLLRKQSISEQRFENEISKKLHRCHSTPEVFIMMNRLRTNI